MIPPLSPVRRLMFAAVLAVPALFLSLIMAIDGAPLGSEARVAADIQSLDWFEPLARFLNAAMSANTWLLFLLPIPVFVLSKVFPGQRRLTELLWVSVLLAFAAGVNPLLKDVIDSPRPTLADGIEVDRMRNSNGYPSGHVTSSILLLGSIAAFAWMVVPRRAAIAVTAVAVAVIALIGPSRIVVGAHWPSDVFGGYLIGSTLFCLVWGIFGLTIGPWRAQQDVLEGRAVPELAPARPPEVPKQSLPKGSGARRRRR